jgi:hypothetical protein
MEMKLIRDGMNGDRWQWRYYDTESGLWFDYYDSFATKAEALQFKSEEGGE